MANTKSKANLIVDEGLVVEKETYDLLEHEWKNLVFLGLIVLLGVFFYSQYQETVKQRDADASSQFTSISEDISGLVSATLKGENSKELLEKEDRVLKNISRLSGSKGSTYAALSGLFENSYEIFKGKAPSKELLDKIDASISLYKENSQTLVMAEIFSLLKCRLLLEGENKSEGLTALKSFLKDSKVLFGEASSLLLISSSDESLLEENLNYIREQLKLRPDLEEATNKALSELGYSL